MTIGIVAIFKNIFSYHRIGAVSPNDWDNFIYKSDSNISQNYFYSKISIV